jgi:flagellin-specific chaperone FliS
MPGGKKVGDIFNNYLDRASLYELLDDGVFEFLQETDKFMETENIKTKGKEIKITINNVK